MKKLTFLILISLFIIPFFVHADSPCDVYVNDGHPSGIGCFEINQDNTYYCLNGPLIDSSCSLLFSGIQNAVLDCQGFTIDGWGGGGIWYNDGIRLYGSSEITIKNCVIKDFYTGILFESSSSNTLMDTIVEDNIEGIRLYKSNQNTIINNVAKNNIDYGIKIEDSYENEVFNNIFSDNGGHQLSHGSYDFFISGSCNNFVEDNTGTGNKPIKFFNYPVSISKEIFSELILCDADYSDIKNVTIGDSSLKNNGLYIYKTDHSNFSSIQSSFNSDGLLLYDSENNRITNSIVTNNQRSGMGIWEKSSKNSFINNIVTRNEVGFNIIGRDNLLERNYICNNTYQDFFLQIESDNIGLENSCDKPGGWNDTGVIGCTYSCLKDLTATTITKTTTSTSTSTTMVDHSECPEIEWEAVFGGKGYEIGVDLVELQDGGFIIVGETTSFGAGESDIYILRVDSDGKKIWEKTYGGASWDGATSVTTTQDGKIVIAGSLDGYIEEVESDAFLMKLNLEGNIIWEKRFGGPNWDRASSVRKTSDKGFIVVGTTSSPQYNQYIYVVKFDSNGVLEWEKTYDGNWGNDILQTSDGNYLIGGSESSKGAGSSDFYLLKINPEGDLLWDKTFGGRAADDSCSILEDNDNNYYIVGDTYSLGSDVPNILLVKTDSKGNELWMRTYDHSDFDIPSSITKDIDGSIFIAGVTEDWGNKQAHLLKVDSNGDKICEKFFGGSEYELIYSVKSTKENGLIIVGETTSFGSGRYDVYLVKFKGEGNSCSNGIQDENEEGIDCGGSCPDECAITECNDGLDNDQDGLIDYPEDEDCLSEQFNPEGFDECNSDADCDSNEQCDYYLDNLNYRKSCYSISCKHIGDKDGTRYEICGNRNPDDDKNPRTPNDCREYVDPFETENFNIQYKMDCTEDKCEYGADKNIIYSPTCVSISEEYEDQLTPVYVKKVGEAFEKSYQKYVNSLKFDYDVKLLNVKIEERETPGVSHCSPSPFIRIDIDYLGSEDLKYIPSHEFFHQMQCKYKIINGPVTGQERKWISEGMPTIMADEVYDDINAYIEETYKGSNHLFKKDAPSLNLLGEENEERNSYSASFFWKYLIERLGIDIIREFNEEFKVSNDIEAVDNVLRRKYGSSFEVLFEEWVTANLLKDYNTVDKYNHLTYQEKDEKSYNGKSYPSVELNYDGNINVVFGNNEAVSWKAKYYKFLLDDSIEKVDIIFRAESKALNNNLDDIIVNLIPIKNQKPVFIEKIQDSDHLYFDNNGFSEFYIIVSGKENDYIFDLIVNEYSDVDEDGLSDSIEEYYSLDPFDADTDDDGLIDGNLGSEDLNANGVVDPGETDPRLFDTDGDGISDGVERGLTEPESTDTDMSIFIPDADPSTTTDPTDKDTDGDGIEDGEEDINKNGRIDGGESGRIFINPSWTTPNSVVSYSNQNSHYPASNSIDDSTDSGWRENTVLTDLDGDNYEWYITYDMGDTYDVQKIRVFADGDKTLNPCKVGVIKVCDDSDCSGESNLLDSDCKFSTTKEWQECDFIDTKGRYIYLAGGMYFGSCRDKMAGSLMKYFYEFDAYAAGKSTTTKTTTIATTTTITTTTTVTLEKKCWDGSYEYLRRHRSQLSKFCKCAEGNYGFSGSTYSWIKKGKMYKDVGDNENWETRWFRSFATDRVKCFDGNWYDTNQDYFE